MDSESAAKFAHLESEVVYLSAAIDRLIADGKELRNEDANLRVSINVFMAKITESLHQLTLQQTVWVTKTSVLYGLAGTVITLVITTIVQVFIKMKMG